MSYTVDSKCASCKNSLKCTDEDFIRAGVNGIHGVNRFNYKTNETVNRGHMGNGKIVIDCTNYVPEETHVE